MSNANVSWKNKVAVARDEAETSTTNEGELRKDELDNVVGDVSLLRKISSTGRHQPWMTGSVPARSDQAKRRSAWYTSATKFHCLQAGPALCWQAVQVKLSNR